MRLYFSLLGYFKALTKVKYETGEDVIEARTSAVPMISHLKPDMACLVAPNSLATYFHIMDGYLQKINETTKYETFEELLKEAIINYTDNERVYESIEEKAKTFGTELNIIVSLSEGKYSSHVKDSRIKKLTVNTSVNPNIQRYHLYHTVWKVIKPKINGFISNSKEDSLEFILDVTHGQNYFVIELVQVVQDIATIVASLTKNLGKKIIFRVVSYSPAIPADPSGDPLKFVEIQNTVLTDQIRSFDYFSLKKVNMELVKKLFSDEGKAKIVDYLFEKLQKISLSLSFGFFLHLVDLLFEVEEFEKSQRKVDELIGEIFKRIEENIEVKIESSQDSVSITLKQSDLKLCDGFYDILKTLVAFEILKYLRNICPVKHIIKEIPSEEIFEHYKQTNMNAFQKQLKRVLSQTGRFYKLEDLENISNTIWKEKVGLENLISTQVRKMKKGNKYSEGFFSSIRDKEFNKVFLFNSSSAGGKDNITRNFIAHCGIIHRGFFYIKIGNQSNFEIYISPNHSILQNIFKDILI